MSSCYLDFNFILDPIVPFISPFSESNDLKCGHGTAYIPGPNNRGRSNEAIADRQRVVYRPCDLHDWWTDERTNAVGSFVWPHLTATLKREHSSSKIYKTKKSVDFENKITGQRFMDKFQKIIRIGIWYQCTNSQKKASNMKQNELKREKMQKSLDNQHEYGHNNSKSNH